MLKIAEKGKPFIRAGYIKLYGEIRPLFTRVRSAPPGLDLDDVKQIVDGSF